jgi:hypothetical protein
VTLPVAARSSLARPGRSKVNVSENFLFSDT